MAEVLRTTCPAWCVGDGCKAFPRSACSRCLAMRSGTASVQTDPACAGRASIAQPGRQAGEVVFASGLVYRLRHSEKHPDHIPHRESFHGVSFPEKEPDHILIRPSFDRLSWAFGRGLPRPPSLWEYGGRCCRHREPIRPSTGIRE